MSHYPVFHYYFSFIYLHWKRFVLFYYEPLPRMLFIYLFIYNEMVIYR
jgi:hypothetical protein